MSNQTTSFVRKLFDNFEEILSVVSSASWLPAHAQVGARWFGGTACPGPRS
jgi:hypothetical protein